MQNAAAALLLGWDPMSYSLAGETSPTDRMFADAVLRAAAELRNEQRSAELTGLVEAIGVSVGNRVAEVLAKAFRA